MIDEEPHRAGQVKKPAGKPKRSSSSSSSSSSRSPNSKHPQMKGKNVYRYGSTAHKSSKLDRRKQQML